jgi:hypothetical protein
MRPCGGNADRRSFGDAGARRDLVHRDAKTVR